jgi:hypothetical protein
MKFSLSSFAAAAALTVATAASAAPTASLTGASFVEYLGTTPMAEVVPATVQWFLESQNQAWIDFDGNQRQVDSYLVFFQPGGTLQTLTGFSGSITFDTDVLVVWTAQSSLQDTAAYGKAGVTYDYSNRFIGLEQLDFNSSSLAGPTLQIGGWRASNPGDYVRVFAVTAVPEPGTYAMLLAGLGVVGFVALRSRRRDD